MADAERSIDVDTDDTLLDINYLCMTRQRKTYLVKGAMSFPVPNGEVQMFNLST